MVDDMNASSSVSASRHHTHEYSSIVFYTAAAIIAAIFIRFFVAAPYIVSGASMDPSFETWDYLVIDRVTYQFEEPQRGDVVVFRYPYDPSRSFIKRVIGLPGETVLLQGDSVIIRNAENQEGVILEEPYVAPENTRPSEMTVELTDDQYFVMGDNRRASADSRTWGALPEDNIVGRAFVRLFPLSHIDLLPGVASYK